MFHNAGCSGAVDIVGIKDNEVYLFDVKTYRGYINGKKSSQPNPRSEEQKSLGVQYILFDPATRKLRLRKHRE